MLQISRSAAVPDEHTDIAGTLRAVARFVVEMPTRADVPSGDTLAAC